MARRDPGNKPARRIGIAWVAVLVVIVIILGVFVMQVARPTSRVPAPVLNKVPPTAR